MKLFLFIATFLILPLSAHTVGKGRPKDKIPFTEIKQAFERQLALGLPIGDCEITQFRYQAGSEHTVESILMQFYTRERNKNIFASLYTVDEEERKKQSVLVISLANGWKEINATTSSKGTCVPFLGCTHDRKEIVEIRFHPEQGVKYVYDRYISKRGYSPGTDYQGTCGQRN